MSHERAKERTEVAVFQPKGPVDPTTERFVLQMPYFFDEAATVMVVQRASEAKQKEYRDGAVDGVVTISNEYWAWKRAHFYYGIDDIHDSPDALVEVRAPGRDTFVLPLSLAYWHMTSIKQIEATAREREPIIVPFSRTPCNVYVISAEERDSILAEAVERIRANEASRQVALAEGGESAIRQKIKDLVGTMSREHQETFELYELSAAAIPKGGWDGFVIREIKEALKKKGIEWQPYNTL